MYEKLGISTYTYSWSVGVPGYEKKKSSFTVMDLLEKAKKHNVGVLQIADNLPLHVIPEKELTLFKNKADALDIKLEIGMRGIESDELIKYLKIAEKLDSKLVRTIIHSKKGKLSFNETVKHLKEAIPYFERSNITLAIENHEKHSANELIQIIKTVDSKNVGICLDTVNSFGILESPNYVIKKLAPYVVNIHFKDFKIERIKSQMGFMVVGAPAGKGQLDIEFLLNEMKKYNRNVNYILELWTPFQKNTETTIKKELEWAEKSIAYLKEYL